MIRFNGLLHLDLPKVAIYSTFIGSCVSCSETMTSEISEHVKFSQSDRNKSSAEKIYIGRGRIRGSMETIAHVTPKQGAGKMDLRRLLKAINIESQFLAKLASDIYFK